MVAGGKVRFLRRSSREEAMKSFDTLGHATSWVILSLFLSLSLSLSLSLCRSLALSLPPFRASIQLEKRTCFPQAPELRADFSPRFDGPKKPRSLPKSSWRFTSCPRPWSMTLTYHGTVHGRNPAPLWSWGKNPRAFVTAPWY